MAQIEPPSGPVLAPHSSGPLLMQYQEVPAVQQMYQTNRFFTVNASFSVTVLWN